MRGIPYLELIASVVLIAAALGALHLHESPDSSDTPPDPTAVEWRILNETDSWRIVIDDIEPICPANVSIAIIGGNDCLPKMDDPSGFAVPLMGDLDDMRFNATAFGNANVTNGTYFHSRDPDGLRNMNITLFMVFVDLDDDGRLSSGDEVWFRFEGPLSPCSTSGSFKMVNNEVEGEYGSLPIPGI